MSGLVFWIFYKLSQHPLLIALLIALALDVLVFGFRARLVRHLRGSRRVTKLESLLAINPHDRRSRFELAELLMQRRRYARAVEVLKPNVEFGEHDAETLLLMGRACSGAGHFPQAVVFLEEASPLAAARGLGEAELALGEHWLRVKDAARAEEALLRFCKDRPGSIEGWLQLSWAQVALGKTAESSRARRQAWLNYAEAPRFVRKRDRLWAFRVRPARTAVVGLVFVAGIAAASLEVSAVFGKSAAAIGQAEEDPELVNATVPSAIRTQAWTPRALQVRIAGAAGRAEELNLELYALRRGRGGDFFAARGADAWLECAGCGDPWQAAALLRDLRRFAAVKGPALEMRLDDGSSIHDYDAGRFLARQLRCEGGEPRVFAFLVSVTGTPEDLAAAGARVRAAFEAAGLEGLFPFGRVSIQTGLVKRLAIVIGMDTDDRTAISALEVLREPLCPGGRCLETHFTELSRPPLLQMVLQQETQSTRERMTKNLLGWFNEEDRLLERCQHELDVQAPARVLSRHPALAPLLQGRAIGWRIELQQGPSLPSRGAGLALDSEGNLLAGAHFLEGRGPSFFEERNGMNTLWSPSSNRTRSFKAGQHQRFMGMFGDAAVLLEWGEQDLWSRATRETPRPRVAIHGLDGSDFAFPELRSVAYDGMRAPGDRVALLETSGETASLVVHSLASRELRRVELPLRMPRDLSLAAADNGDILVLATPDEESAGRDTAIFRVTGDRVELAAKGFAPDWKEILEEVDGAAWLARGEDEPGVLAVPLRQPGGAAQLARSPEGAELEWARPQKDGVLASAKDGLWFFQAGGARRLLPQSIDAARSREGTVAASVEGLGIVLLGSDGAREELRLTMRSSDISWGQIIEMK
jgi:tetratricopeptide (TPR) repeat protein